MNKIERQLLNAKATKVFFEDEEYANNFIRSLSDDFKNEVIIQKYYDISDKLYVILLHCDLITKQYYVAINHGGVKIVKAEKQLLNAKATKIFFDDEEYADSFLRSLSDDFENSVNIEKHYDVLNKLYVIQIY